MLVRLLCLIVKLTSLFKPNIFKIQTEEQTQYHTHKECHKRCIYLIKKGSSVFFFSEGTRSKDGKLGAFKKGAFVLAAKTNVPVVPITRSNIIQKMLALNSIMILGGTSISEKLTALSKMETGFGGCASATSMEILLSICKFLMRYASS